MRYFIVCVTLVLFTSSGLSAQVTSAVESQRGEKWWGIFRSGVPNGPLQPFNLQIDPSHKNGVPLVISSSGRYIWHPDGFGVSFDGEVFEFSSANPVSVQKGGKNLREAYLLAVHKNLEPAGQTPDSRFFTMPVYETAYEIGALQCSRRISEYADKIIDQGLPPGIIVIPEGWSVPGSVCVLNKQLYDDPLEFISSLKEKGFSTLLTVTPAVPAYGRSFALLSASGLLLTDGNGDPIVARTQMGYTAFFNFASAEVIAEFSLALGRLSEQFPVDGFRFDCSAVYDLVPERDKGLFMENWLSLGQNVGMCEYTVADHGAFPSYLAGLPAAEDPLASINAIVYNGLTGLPYTYIQVPAAPARTERELADMFLFRCSMPVFSVPFAPWRITDRELYENVRQAISLRAGMGPYISAAVAESARTAEPLLRSMEYQFPRNGFSDCTDQFMLGSKYLFAPIVDGGTVRTVRLPKGNWIGWDGRKYRGPLVLEVSAEPGTLIYFTH